jgi:hypothetical protein
VATTNDNNQNKTAVELLLVLGYIATKDLATIEKKVAVLVQLGYSNADMVKICGTKDNVIRTMKSRLKKGES